MQAWRDLRPRSSGRSRNTGPTLARGNVRSSQQHAEWLDRSAHAQRTARMQSGTDSDVCTGANTHTVMHNFALMQVAGEYHSILGERCAITNLYQVPSAAPHVHAAMDVHPSTDARAQHSVRPAHQFGTFNQAPRDSAGNLFNHPLAYKLWAPCPNATNVVPIDENALCCKSHAYADW